MSAAVPTVVVTPNPVAPGQPFTATISGLSPNKIVYPYFDVPIPIDAAQNALPVTANSVGIATWTRTILTSTAIGTYALKIFDADVGSTIASVNLAVQPIQNFQRRVQFIDSDSVTLGNGSTVSVGETLHVGVFDFPANTTVRVIIEDVAIATFQTAFNGAGTTSFSINRAGAFNLRINESGSSADYGAINISVQDGTTPPPPPIIGDIDPMLLVVGGIVVVAGAAAFALSGGLKKIPKIL